MTLPSQTVVVNTTVDSSSVTTQGFGRVAVAGAATFPESYRIYTSASAVAADSAVLSSTQLGELNQIFAGTPTPVDAVAFKIQSKVAKVVRFTVDSAGDGDVFTVTVDGTDYTYTNSPQLNENAIAEAIKDLIEADGSAVVTAAATGTDPYLDVTADVAGVDFTYANTANITAVVTTPNRNYSSELSDIFATFKTFYGVIIESREKVDIEDVANWCETNKRFYCAQTSDADVKNGVASNVAENLKNQSRTYTQVVYHTPNNEYLDGGSLARQLTFNPDQYSTGWRNFQVTGITAPLLTDTEKTNIISNNANFYEADFKGVPVFFGGTQASGMYSDIRLLADWFTARVGEAISQLLLSKANQGSKIPYTDEGKAMVKAKILSVMQTGIEVGHFEDGTQSVTFPVQTEADIANRIFRCSCSIRATGAIYEINVAANISLT